MTQDEIICMARDADKDFAIALIALEQITPFLERFAALVAAHEKKFWMAQIEVECNEAVLAERDKALEAARTVGGEFFVEFEKVYLK